MLINELIFSSEEDAQTVVLAMNDVLTKYGVVSKGDLCDLVGVPNTYIDAKRGWKDLKDVEVRRIEKGWAIALPQSEEI